MLCTKCGNQNATGAVCKKCGSPLLSRLDDDPVEKKKTSNSSDVVEILDASNFDDKDDKKEKKKKKEKKPVANIPILGEQASDDTDDDVEELEEEKEEENKEDKKEEKKQEKVEEKKEDKDKVNTSNTNNAIPIAQRQDEIPIEETNPSLETPIPGGTQEVKVLDPITNNNSSPISLSNIVANNSDINNFSVPADFRFTDEVVEEEEETPANRVEDIRQQVSLSKKPKPVFKKNKKRIRRRIRGIIYKVIGFISIVVLIYYFISKYLFPHAFIFKF